METGMQGIEHRQEILSDNGFVIPNRWFADGTDFNKIGEKAYRQQRKRVDDLPLAEDIFQETIQFVEEEERQDYLVKADPQNMQMDGNCLRVSTMNNGMYMLPFEGDAFDQFTRKLCSSADLPMATRHLSDLRPEDRSQHVNKIIRKYIPSHLNRIEKEYKDKVRRLNSPPRGRKPSWDTPIYKFRTRKIEGIPTIFAVVSDSYSTVDLDTICKIVSDAVDHSWKGEVVTNGFRSTIRLIKANPLDPEETGVGEVLRIALTVKTSDDGSRAIEITSGAYMAICKNLTTVNTDGYKTTRKHIGDADKVKQEVAQMVKRAEETFGEIPRLFAEAKKDRIIERIGGDGPQKVFTRLVDEGLVKTKGTRKKELKQRLIRTYRQDPNPTRHGVIQTITRAAHEYDWASPWVTEDLEEQAGELLHVKVWNKYNWG